MGKIKQGILGGFSGAVGNVVGAQWKGIDYMRVKPSNVTNPKTPAQVAQREKFARCYQILKPFKDVLKKGLASVAVGMSPYNWAMSNVLKNVVSGVAPNFIFAPENFILSKGVVSTLYDAVVDSTDVGKISLTWDVKSNDSAAKDSDTIQLIGYDSVSNNAFILDSANTRVEKSTSITVPDDFAGVSVHCYVICKDETSSSQSDSQFVGTVTVASE